MLGTRRSPPGASAPPTSGAISSAASRQATLPRVWNPMGKVAMAASPVMVRSVWRAPGSRAARNKPGLGSAERGRNHPHRAGPGQASGASAPADGVEQCRTPCRAGDGRRPSSGVTVTPDRRHIRELPQTSHGPTDALRSLYRHGFARIAACTIRRRWRTRPPMPRRSWRSRGSAMPAGGGGGVPGTRLVRLCHRRPAAAGRPAGRGGGGRRHAARGLRASCGRC